MSSQWLEAGFGEGSSEELERSMEQEVEGLFELDDLDGLDLVQSSSEQITADLLRAESSPKKATARSRSPKAARSPRQRGR